MRIQTKSLTSKNPPKFRKLPRPLPVVTSEDTETGRFYQTPEGRRYRSVTTFLGSLPKDQYLKDWVERVGQAEATKLMRQGGNRGSRLHDSVERYLLGETVTITNPLDQMLFKHMVPFLNRVNNVMAMEAGLYSDALELAGRCDLIATVDGIPHIIDFKTMTEDRKIPSGYWLQTTAYSMMFHERTGIHIPRLCIAAVADDGGLKVEFSNANLWKEKLIFLLQNPTRTDIL